MTKQKEKVSEPLSRKSRVICSECLKAGNEVRVTGNRREHLRDEHQIMGEDGALIPKSAVRKYFLKEGEKLEQEAS